MKRFAIGIDVGGTFTDGVAADESGRIFAAKTPSTPPDYGQGVLTAIEELAATAGISSRELLASAGHLAHGTTSSINALVQGRGARVGFLTTKGHRDSIYIMNVEGRYLGRSAHEIQDVLRTRKPAPLVPKQRAKEVTERIDFAGEVIVPLDEREAREAIHTLLEDGAQAIAVSFLWSFRNPVHERRVRELVEEIAPGSFVTLSSEVSPRIREFARSATTITNCQIAPALREYLVPLGRELAERGLRGPLLVMQGSGGTITADEAPAAAITTIGSVLSGGVIGSLRLGRQLGHRNVITTDVGGTTFLAGLIVNGEPVRSSTMIVNQHPLNVPALEVHAIGAGGGAIAWVDGIGNLHVGPQSAEAVPGPACYGQGGTRPTNTDANLVLGILSERGLLGGRKPLDRALAERAIREHVAEPLGLDLEKAAAAIHAIQNAQAADLLRKVVVEAGFDPREFVVYAFGGAGPAHCAAYAAELGVAEVIVPLGPVASAFSAYGLAAAGLSATAELSDPAPFPLNAERARSNFARLEAEVRGRLARQNVETVAVEVQRELDVRYSMQMNELSVPVPAGEIDDSTLFAVMDAFETQYQRLNGEGTGFREAGMQAITYRARALAALPFDLRLPKVARATSTSAESARIEHRRACLDVRVGFVDTPIYDYARLAAGHVLGGPAIIEAPTTTVVVPPGTQGTIDELGNLVLHYGRS